MCFAVKDINNRVFGWEFHGYLGTRFAANWAIHQVLNGKTSSRTGHTQKSVSYDLILYHFNVTHKLKRKIDSLAYAHTHTHM